MSNGYSNYGIILILLGGISIAVIFLKKYQLLYAIGGAALLLIIYVLSIILGNLNNLSNRGPYGAISATLVHLDYGWLFLISGAILLIIAPYLENIEVVTSNPSKKDTEKLDNLEKLASLKEKGIISEDEFKQQKTKLIQSLNEDSAEQKSGVSLTQIWNKDNYYGFSKFQILGFFGSVIALLALIFPFFSNTLQNITVTLTFVDILGIASEQIYTMPIQNLLICILMLVSPLISLILTYSKKFEALYIVGGSAIFALIGLIFIIYRNNNFEIEYGCIVFLIGAILVLFTPYLSKMCDKSTKYRHSDALILPASIIIPILLSTLIYGGVLLSLTHTPSFMQNVTSDTNTSSEYVSNVTISPTGLPTSVATPIPGALLLNTPSFFKSEGSSNKVSAKITQASILDSYILQKPNAYQKISPATGKKFVKISVEITDLASSDRIYSPKPSDFTLIYNGSNYSPENLEYPVQSIGKNYESIGLEQKEIADGSIIYEVPDALTLNKTYIQLGYGTDPIKYSVWILG